MSSRRIPRADRGRVAGVDWDSRVMYLLRQGLGAAAFGLAYAHTVEWLSDHEIKGLAGYITAACVDVLAFICLRELTRATDRVVRFAFGAGFLATLLVSLVAQVEEGSNGHGAGPALSTIPVLAFGFLTIMSEVQRARGRAGQGGHEGGHETGHVSAPDVRPQVATTTWPVSALGRPELAVVSALVSAPVATEVSALASGWVSAEGRPELALARPPARPLARSGWVYAEGRNELSIAIPEVAKKEPASKPEKQKPTKKQSASAPDLRLLNGRGSFTLPAVDRKLLESGEMTREQAAKKHGVSVRTVRRVLNSPPPRARSAAR